MAEKQRHREDKHRLVDEFCGKIYRKMHTGLGAYLAPFSVSLLLWLLYLLKRFAGFDLYDSLHSEQLRYNHHPLDKTPLYLGAATVGTIGAIIVGSMSSRKAGRLVRNGVETTGTVIAKSDLSSGGMSPTTIVYTVNGKEFRFRRDLPAKLYQVGDTVRILYDPLRPTSRDVLGTV